MKFYPFISKEWVSSSPMTSSYIYHHTGDGEEISESLLNEPIMLGIDEAGRGPVLGPMVYGIAYCPINKLEELKKIGFDDSKKLTEEQRDGLLDVIKEKKEWIGWSISALSPCDISVSMMGKIKYNLNEISHDAAIDLIRKTIARGVNLREVYVDTVGPPEKYQAKLSALFPGIKMTVSKKADSIYPIVSAASICAKVSRDQILSNWNFVEPGLQDKVSLVFGSGYPGDPNTKQWLKDTMDPVFGFPRLLRFSWSTCTKILEEEAIRVRWPAEEEEEAVQTGMKRKQTKLDHFVIKKDKGILVTRFNMHNVGDF